MRIKRLGIIGVPISVVNMDTCINAIFDDFESKRGKYICVSNVHTTVMAHDDPDYYRVQASSLMSIPDGKPLSIVGKWKCPEMDRVTGPNLMRRVFEESKNKEIRHYFYGNNKENLDALLNQLKRVYPWLIIAGAEPSVFRDMTEQEEEELKNRMHYQKKT